jgi:hypothetical protein
MEGSFVAHEGDWINVGYTFKATTKDYFLLQFQQTVFSFIYTCDQGGKNLLYWNITVDTMNYAGKSGPSLDEHVAWPPGWAKQFPALCGAGQPIYSTTQGGSIQSVAYSNISISIQAQFHYRVPGAKGGTFGNVALWSWCPLNKGKSGQYGSTCGASWSATHNYQIPACPFLTSGAMSLLRASLPLGIFLSLSLFFSFLF